MSPEDSSNYILLAEDNVAEKVIEFIGRLDAGSKPSSIVKKATVRAAAQ